VCLGKTLAELEGVYVLVGLLQRFRFSLAEPQVPVRYNVSTTLQMKEPGLSVTVCRQGGSGLQQGGDRVRDYGCGLR